MDLWLEHELLISKWRSDFCHFAEGFIITNIKSSQKFPNLRDLFGNQHDPMPLIYSRSFFTKGTCLKTVVGRPYLQLLLVPGLQVVSNGKAGNQFL